jgi:hypothetical protein
MDADRSHSWFAPRAAQFSCTAEMADEFERRRIDARHFPADGAPFEMARGR